MEKFKDVVGYEGLYQVSDKGNIIACEKIDKKGHHRKEKILKPGKSGKKDRYQALHVVLYKNGVKKTILVHILVATAFIPNPGNLPQVNHKDENPFNNCVENLEWCTQQYNISYGTSRIRAGIKNSIILKNRSDQSLPVNQYSLDGQFIARYDSTMEAERQNPGLFHAAISKCCKGKSKTHGGFRWTYA